MGIQDCPICLRILMNKREVEARKYLYECKKCGYFVIDLDTLRDLKEIITNNREKLSTAIKQVSEETNPVFIVLDKKDEYKDYYTIRELLDL